MPSPQSKRITCDLIKKVNIENQLARFWEIEKCASNEEVRTSEEQLCEEFLVKHVKRNKDGRFVVKISLKRNPDALGDSKQSAKHRFLKLEAKLSRNIELRDLFSILIRFRKHAFSDGEDVEKM